MITPLGFDSHRQAQGHGCASAPFSLDTVKRSRFCCDQLLVVYFHLCFLCPGRNAQAEGEPNGVICPYRELQGIVEGIVGLQINPKGFSCDLSGDRAGGIRHCNKASIIGPYPQVRREFRPALMHVCRTASIVRFQAKDIGFRAIGLVDVVLRDLAEDLIGLLIVLVGPHVGLEGCRQGVERNALQAVREPRIAQNANEGLQREHVFDHGAQFRALRGILSRIVLIAREKPRCLPVVGIERFDDLEDGVVVSLIPRLAEPDSWLLDRHGVVHDMRGLVALLPLHLVLVVKRLKMTPPVVSLLTYFGRELKKPTLRGAVVEPVNAQHQISPPGLSPVEQWLLVK